MVINSAVRTIAEIGIGLLYFIGAIFNSLYTFRHGDEFYGSFAKGTLLPPVRVFINRIVIPNSKPFTLLLIGFQLVTAFAILSRGPYASYGLYAGALFCLVAAVASNVAGAAANLVLAVAQYLLAYSK